MVDLILQSRGPHLAEPLELIERHRLAVWQQKPMECDGQTLLAKAVDGFGLAQQPSPLRNQQVLTVGGVHIGRHHRVDRSRERAVQSIGQDRLDHGAFG